MSTLKYTFAGNILKLSSRVKHKYVRRAQNLMTDWMLKNIDMTVIMEASDGKEASMSEMLQAAILAKPQLAADIQDLENSMIIDQTIMLASGLEHEVLIELKEEAFEDEYIELYEKCQKLLGGNANHFFEVYRTGSISARSEKKTPKRPLKKDTPQE